VTQHRVGDDLQLLLAAFLEIQRGVDLAERAHRFLAELEQLLHLSADATIGDRRQQPGEGCVLWRVSVQTIRIPVAPENETGAPWKMRRLTNRARYLEDANVLGAGTLRPTTLVVGHLLALTKLLVANAFDGGHVEEQVGSRAVLDETETLVSESLDRTFRHRRRSC
jgi:hypothetical protein